MFNVKVRKKVAFSFSISLPVLDTFVQSLYVSSTDEKDKMKFSLKVKYDRAANFLKENGKNFVKVKSYDNGEMRRNVREEMLSTKANCIFRHSSFEGHVYKMPNCQKD